MGSFTAIKMHFIIFYFFIFAELFMAECLKDFLKFGLSYREQ